MEQAKSDKTGINQDREKPQLSQNVGVPQHKVAMPRQLISTTVLNSSCDVQVEQKRSQIDGSFFMRTNLCNALVVQENSYSIANIMAYVMVYGRHNQSINQ